MSPSSFQALTALEKRSVFLVLIGTFLEYFDLILYVHLATVLNPIFFPDSDPFVAGLLGVFAFSSTYVIRPLGAFVFGYMGDYKGRKTTIVWTSCLMAFASFTIGCLPSYASFGVAAPVLFLMARMLQGFSSVGEFVNAKVYTVEISAKSRNVHFLGMLPHFTVVVGGLAALLAGITCVGLDPVNGWRWPFLCGTAVALVGGIVRLRALESPVFKQNSEKNKKPTLNEVRSFLSLLKVRAKNYWCYGSMEMLSAFVSYFVMVYCPLLLKNTVGLSATQVMHHNFWMWGCMLAILSGLGWLTRFYDPFVLLKRRFFMGICLLPLLFYGLTLWPHAEEYIFVVQILTCSLLGWSAMPAFALVALSFPVVGRFTNLGSAFAFFQSFSYALTAFVIFLSDIFWGVWGVGFLFLVVSSLALYGAVAFVSPILPIDRQGKKRFSLQEA